MNRRSALDEAREAVLDRERRRAERGAGQDTEARWDLKWVAAAVAAWLVVFWAVVAPTGPFQGPQAERFAPPPHLTEASLRYGVWLAAHRVQAFSGRMHRLPVDLEEAGMSSDRALHYQRGAGQRDYSISANSGSSSVTFRAGESLDVLLDESMDRLNSGR